MSTIEKPYRVTSDFRSFGVRLAQALEAAGFDHDIPGITRRFNFLTPSATVTTHAVRKWLSGKSIPTQDRLRTLALLVGVTPEWLRYGKADDEQTRETTHFDNFPERWRAVAFDLALLDEHHHKIVERFVALLIANSAPPKKTPAYQRGARLRQTADA